MAKKSSATGLSKTLAIIGGIVIVIQSVMGLIGLNLVAILGLLVGLAVLVSTGVVKSATFIPFNGIVILILGVLGWLWGGWIGGLITIIAGVLLLLGK